MIEAFERLAAHFDGNEHRAEGSGCGEGVEISIALQRHPCPSLDGVGCLRRQSFAHHKHRGSPQLIARTPKCAEIVLVFQAHHTTRKEARSARAGSRMIICAEKLHIEAHVTFYLLRF